MKKRIRPEILAPAGDFTCLQAALDAGADAVYFGLGTFNMRARGGVNFCEADLPEVAARCRAAGVKAYLTLNAIMFEDEAEEIDRIVAYAKPFVDAFIVSDWGVISICRRHGAAFHISTQMSTSNSAAVEFLAQNGYHTITPHELYMAFTDNGPLPNNPVLITFDDGYDDNYTNAFPILKKYGLQATIFVITSLMDQNYPGYLTWGHAAEMEASGIVTIESHTVSHGSLTDLTDEQIRHELTDAKHEIEQRLGKEVEFLAYPTGAYNLHIASLVKEAGYKGAFTVRNGNMDSATNLYAIERVPIFQTSDTCASFLERLKFLPLFERIGWKKN